MEKCPNCNVDKESNFDVCWKCNYSFKLNKVLTFDDDNIKSIVKCLRCEVEMKYGGESSIRFYEDSVFGQLASGRNFELKTVDIYNCKSCGKTEFFNLRKA